MLRNVSDLEGFFGSTQATKNGYEIWNTECYRAGSLKQ